MVSLALVSLGAPSCAGSSSARGNGAADAGESGAGSAGAGQGGSGAVGGSGSNTGGAPAAGNAGSAQAGAPGEAGQTTGGGSGAGATSGGTTNGGEAGTGDSVETGGEGGARAGSAGESGAGSAEGGRSAGEAGAGGEAGGGSNEPPPVLACVTQVLASGSSTFALDDQGRLFAWGWAQYGTLGLGPLENGNLTYEFRPKWVDGIPDPVSDVGHSCARTEVGDVWCWGYNYGGRVGDGTEITRWEPVLVHGFTHDVERLASASIGHQCAIDDEGAVWCWGYNAAGQVGDGTTDARLQPARVPLTGEFVSVAAGYNHTCALSAQGSVFCWGANDDGQIGIDTEGETAFEPAQVAALGTGVRSLHVALNTNCAVMLDGSVRCWGEFYWNPGQTASDPVVELTDVKLMSLDHQNLCVVKNDGSLWCWGNAAPQFEYPFPATDEPYAVDHLDGEVIALTSGRYHMCALLADHSLWCFGSNSAGELGLGDYVARSEFTRVTNCETAEP